MAKGSVCSFYLDIQLETSYVFPIETACFIKPEPLLEELQIMYTRE
jgi:hypothetical protein